MNEPQISKQEPQTSETTSKSKPKKSSLSIEQLQAKAEEVEASLKDIRRELKIKRQSKAKKENDQKRKERTRKLIILGSFFVESLAESPENFLESIIDKAKTDLEEMKNDVKENDKAQLKIISDREILLKTLEEIKAGTFS